MSLPPRQRHDGAGGVLVRGRDVDQARRPGGVGRSGAYAFFVHRHRVDGQPGGHEGLGRAPVGRVFHPDGVAVVGQQAGAQLQRLLGAAGDDDLVGIELHAAEHAQVVGDGPAQRGVAARGVVVQHVRVGHAPVLVLQPLPERERKRAEVGDARGEGLDLQFGGAKALGEGQAALRQPARRGGRSTSDAAGTGRGAGHRVVDIGAAADPAEQVALDAELVDRRHHGVAREVQVLRQVAAGRQAFAGAELALQHGAAQCFVELAVQGQGVVRAQSVHLAEQEFGEHGQSGAGPVDHDDGQVALLSGFKWP